MKEEFEFIERKNAKNNIEKGNISVRARIKSITKNIRAKTKNKTKNIFEKIRISVRALKKINNNLLMGVRAMKEVNNNLLFVRVFVIFAFALLSTSILNSMDTEAKITEAQAQMNMDFLKDWKAVGLLVSVISLCVVAALYILSEFLENKEFKAFVKEELVQSIASMIFVVILVLAAALLDTLVVSYLTEVRPDFSNINDPANDILTQTEVLLKEEASRILGNNIDVMAEATEVKGRQLRYMYFLMLGDYYRPNAGLSIEGEKNRVLFQNAVRMLAAVNAQKNFLSFINYPLAPLILLLGIFFRNVYFTRKLGGMFLALAIALIFVLPLLYMVQWFMFNGVYTGSGSILKEETACPDICKKSAPEFAGAVNCNDDSTCKYCPTDCRKIPLPERCAVCNLQDANLWSKYTAGTLTAVEKELFYSQCAEAACYDCNSNCKIDFRKTIDIGVPITNDYKIEDPLNEGTYMAFQDYCDSRNCSKSQCPDECRIKIPLYEQCSECIGKNSPDSTGSPIFQPFCLSCRVRLYSLNQDSLNTQECTSIPGCNIAYPSPTANPVANRNLFNSITYDSLGMQWKSCYYAMTDNFNSECSSSPLCGDYPESCRISNLNINQLSKPDGTACDPFPADCLDNCKGSVPSTGKVTCDSYARNENGEFCSEQCRIKGLDLGDLQEIEVDGEKCSDLCSNVEYFDTVNTPPLGNYELDECKFDPPDEVDCSSSCSGCPESCRISGVGYENLYYYDSIGAKKTCNEESIKEKCSSCPTLCHSSNPASTSCSACDKCPSACRFKDAGLMDLIVYKTDEDGTAHFCTEISADCNSCPLDCKKEIPDKVDCSSKCSTCPQVCRERGVDMQNTKAYLEISAGTFGWKKCPEIEGCSGNSCPGICKDEVKVKELADCKTMCKTCADGCRINIFGLKDSCFSDDCISCPDSCKAEIPQFACDNCKFCASFCLNSPAIPNCEELCGESPSIASATDLNSEATGGTTSIGRLYLPSFILPIINIIILFGFVRILSPLLGGDVELPGKAKIL